MTSYLFQSFLDRHFANPEGQLDQTLEQSDKFATDEFGFSRSKQDIIEFLAKFMKPGRWLIYGASTVTRSIWDQLGDKPEIDVVGVIDRSANSIEQFKGVPVFSADQWYNRSDEYDYVLVAHYSAENEMLKALEAAGINQDNILTVFTNALFADSQIAQDQKKHVFETDETTDIVVLQTSDEIWRLMTDEDLSQAFSGYSVKKIYFGHEIHEVSDDVFETINVDYSYYNLKRELQRLRPKLIYIMTTAQFANAFAWSLLKAICPDAKIVHEVYDWTFMYSDKFLANSWSVSENSADISRRSETASLDISDIVIHKNGSNLWHEILGHRSGKPSYMFFPCVDYSESEDRLNRQDEQRVRIVFGGSMQSDVELKKKANAAFNFLDYFYLLAEKLPNLDIHLFNLGHRGAEMDSMYQSYADLDGRQGITYHRRAEFSDYQKFVGTCDLGWLYANHEDMSRIPENSMVTLANKCATYWGMGIPLIVNETFHFHADLANKFEAGIVVPSDNPSRIVDAIKNADFRKLRRGAEMLRKHMITTNSSVIESLNKYCSDQLK